MGHKIQGCIGEVANGNEDLADGGVCRIELEPT